MRTFTEILSAALLETGSAMAAYATPYKDAKGKFAKCGIPGAKPI